MHLVRDASNPDERGWTYACSLLRKALTRPDRRPILQSNLEERSGGEGPGPGGWKTNGLSKIETGRLPPMREPGFFRPKLGGILVRRLRVAR